jgi:hypothetical protein
MAEEFDEELDWEVNAAEDAAAWADVESALEEVKLPIVVPRTASSGGAAAREELQELYARLDSVLDTSSGFDLPGLALAYGITQRLAALASLQNKASVLTDAVIQIVDYKKAVPNLKRRLVERLLSDYLQQLAINPDIVQSYLKLILDRFIVTQQVATLNERKELTLVKHTVPRAIAARTVGLFIQDILSALPRTLDAPRITLVQKAYEIGLRRFSKSGLQEMFDYMLTNDKYFPEVQFIKQCQSRLARCDNSVTYPNETPICNIPNRYLARTADRQCYDIRELLPEMARSLETTQLPAYPRPQGPQLMLPRAVRRISDRARREGLVVPQQVDAFLQRVSAANSSIEEGPRRRISRRFTPY